MYRKQFEHLNEIDLDRVEDAEIVNVADGHRDCPFYREGRELSVQVLHFPRRSVVICRHCSKELRSEAPKPLLLEG